METAIKIFNNPQFGEIRTAQTESGEPLFVAKDVCDILGISKHRDAIQKLDEDERGSVRVDTLGGIQEMTAVTESGLYTLIIRSDKKEAKPFRKWVTSEVLPAIRKTGGYIATKEEDTPELIMARGLMAAKDAIDRLQSQNKVLEAKTTLYESIMDENKPKVLFASAVETSDRSCLIAEVAKILSQNGVEIGQNRLFAWMRDKGYLCKHGDYYNQPTQKAMSLGLFEIKKTTITKPDGTVLVNTTPKVTGKGQVYFVNHFLYKEARKVS
jgi:prophage antirepressor-like protein